MNTALLKGNSAAGNGGAVYVSGSPDSSGAGINQRPGRPQQRRRLRGRHLRLRAGYRPLDRRRQSVRGGRRRDRLQRQRVELRLVVDRLGEQRRLLGWRHPYNRRLRRLEQPRERWTLRWGTRRSPTTAPAATAAGSGYPARIRPPSSVPTLSPATLSGAGHVGGGLYQESGDVIRVQSTIVALNRVGAGTIGLDCFSASSGLDSLGYNLIGNADGCSGFGAAGDLFGGRLELGKLGDNGGAKHWTYGRPLQTIALGRGSRAIDHGSASALLTNAASIASRSKTSAPTSGS